jgi:hypothetical protein
MIAAPTLFFDLPMAYPMTAMTPIQTMIASIVSIQKWYPMFSLRIAAFRFV